MATRYFLAAAEAVADVWGFSITISVVSSTITVTIGGVDHVHTASSTSIATAAAELVAELEALTHPYFAAFTWTNPSGGDVVATADVAGVPGTISVTYGLGAVGTPASNTTPATGPNFWNDPENWSGGAVPVNADDVYIQNLNDDLAWGLDQNAVTLASLNIEKSYTGRIGLDLRRFATSANARTFSDDQKPEYREDYLRIGADVVNLGDHKGPGSPAGSGRIKLDNTKAGASSTRVWDTASGSADTGFGAVRLLMANAAAELVVNQAPGGVDVAGDEPGESSTLDFVRVTDTTTRSRVHVGPGVTITEWTQDGGDNRLEANPSTIVDVRGGILKLTGDHTVADVDVEDATLDFDAAIATDLEIGQAGVVNMLDRGDVQTITSLLIRANGALNGSPLVTVNAATGVDGEVTGGVVFA